MLDNKMLLKRPPLPVLMLVLTAGPSLVFSDLVMVISYEGNKDFLINVTFTWKMFTDFCRCLCAGETTSCRAKYKETVDHPVENIFNQSQQNPSAGCRLFRCNNSLPNSSLVCRRINQQQSSCGGGTRSSFVSLRDVPSCDVTCVGLSWALPQEKLVINNPQPEVQICDSQCCPTTSTSVPNLTSLPGNSQSTEAYFSTTLMDEQHNNVSQWWEGDWDTSYTETIIISGVAAGIVFLAFIFFLIILFLKRKSQPAPRLKGNNPASWVLPGPVISVHKPEEKRAPKLCFDQTTISNKGHTNWAAGLIGRLAGQARQDRGEEPHKSGLASKVPAPDGSAHFDGVLRNSSSEDPEYAVIDDAQMQPDGRHYSNINISNGYTDPSSSDNVNDGYSSLDNIDYYNTRETVTISKGGHSDTDDQNNRKQIRPHVLEPHTPRSRQVSPLTYQPSEYCVAKSIIDDTEGEVSSGLAPPETSAETSMRDSTGLAPPETSADTPMREATGLAPPETSADTPMRDAGSREPPNRLTLRSLNQLDRDIGAVGDHKRNTYFELSREGEEDT